MSKEIDLLDRITFDRRITTTNVRQLESPTVRVMNDHPYMTHFALFAVLFVWTYGVHRATR